MRFTRNIILTLLIIVLCSALAFASDESPDSEQTPLEVEDAPFSWVDLEQAEIMKAAQDIKAATATEYTTTDIYNLLYSALRGTSTSSTYSLPFIAYRSTQTVSALTTANDHLSTIRSILAGTASGQTPISNINDALYFFVNNTSYSLSELTGMIWSYVGDIRSELYNHGSDLYNISSKSSSIDSKLSTTNSKLEYVFSAIEDTINIKWYSFGSYLGCKSSRSSSYVNTVTTSSSCFAEFDFSNVSEVPSIIRLFIPFYKTYDASANTFTLNSISAFYDNSYHTVYFDKNAYFIENTLNGIYLYLLDFNHISNGWIYSFEIVGNNQSIINPNFAGSSYSIPFDTLDYQIMKSAFYQANSCESLSQLDTVVSLLSQIAPSLAYQSAESSSQDVINETLDDFTGSGTGAAKRSDSRAMKDVSGSLQSGLNSGGSVSGATGVFNSGSDFWGWFTQQNSNYINNPYPAPTVNSTRGSGDEIVDFLTPNSNELQDLLRQGGDQR